MPLLLLPVLKQLSTQSRWQLWLTPAHKLNRSWMQQSGLPLGKEYAYYGIRAFKHG